jgi:hypothetical protein
MSTRTDTAAAAYLTDSRQRLQAAAYLNARAESYLTDSRTFDAAGRTGRPILGTEDDARFAVIYRLIASELRDTAALVASGELTARHGPGAATAAASELEQSAVHGVLTAR